MSETWQVCPLSFPPIIPTGHACGRSGNDTQLAGVFVSDGTWICDVYQWTVPMDGRYVTSYKKSH